MTTNDSTGRLLRSQQMLWSYRATSASGPLETSLSMIGEEIDTLSDLALESPELAVKFDALADQWRELSFRLKAGF